MTGFDDIPVARHLHPQLTTVRQPIQKLGATAFDVLYSMISGEGRPEPEVVLPTSLVVRGSCGCPAGVGPAVGSELPDDPLSTPAWLSTW